MIVVCGGMYRSGSTWMFNAARIAMAEIGDVGTATEPESLVGHQHYIVKAHQISPFWINNADVVFLSHRDLRDVVASCHRAFDMPLLANVAKEALSKYMDWKPYANYDMRYENMICDQKSEVEKIMKVLGVTCSPEAVLFELGKISFEANRKDKDKPHDALTLLHQKHITDGRHGSWRQTLPREVANAIELECADWMALYDYIPQAKGYHDNA